MSSNNTTPQVTPTEPKREPPKGLKICCACPETKKPRDNCIAQFGEENCASFIEAHKACLRSVGFDVK